jgi:gluconate 5-dehydrogenase
MTKISFDLKGKKVLITGGNRGIGLGIARGMAQAGANVAIIGRQEAKNAEALKELQDIDNKAKAYILDLENIAAIDSAYKNIVNDFGAIDILVNNAGITCRERADKLSLDEFERVMTINHSSQFALSTAYARERISSNKVGSIIMIGSLMCEASRPTTSAYTASKGAVRQLMKAFAIDWAPYGIRCNAIGPGYIETDMTRPLMDDPEFDKWVKNRAPLGDWGKPDDIAGTAIFLASPAAKYITGQIIYVDGGWLATF